MFRTKRQHEGEVLIDHRASPGDPLVIEGQMFESATLTCSHCQRTWLKNPKRVRPRNWCGKCDHYICDDPNCLLLKTVAGPCRLHDRLEVVRNARERGELVAG